ncbi:DUF6084 family protein [Nocardiopsis salina]|uniref:DUF6084 family protein n=1 Tax=Nocardiopsis salina TaxID=245836 RepID=UPI00034CFA19|nr:DUF6084 family protein [Nocardiopsis salina]
MSELSFEVLGVEAERHAAAPTLNVGLRIGEHTGERVHAVALNAQVRIDAQRRSYDEDERAGVVDLFGDPARWGSTLKPFLWTQAAAMVQGFRESTEAQLPMIVTYDFDVAAAKYLNALRGGEVPLSLSFSGTVFTRGSGGFSVERIPWHHDVDHRMPVQVWQELIAHHFPGKGWLRLDHTTITALQRFKSRRGLLSHDEACAVLLREAGVHTP